MLAKLLKKLEMKAKPHVRREASAERISEAADARTQKLEQERKLKIKAALDSLLKGMNAFQAGKPDVAIGNFQAGYLSYRDAGDRKRAALMQEIIGLILMSVEDYKKGDAAFQRSCDMLKMASLPSEVGRILLLRARYEAKIGTNEKMKRWLREAIATYKDAKDTAGTIEALCTDGELGLRRGRRAEAQKNIEEAKTLLEELDDEAKPAALARIADVEAMIG